MSLEATLIDEYKPLYVVIAYRKMVDSAKIELKGFTRFVVIESNIQNSLNAL